MQPNQPIRILLADDHPIVRDGLAAILDAESDLNVIGQASNGSEAVELFRLHQPDVAILDLHMPQMSGVDAISAIRAEFPNPCIIMFTVYDGDEYIYQGLRAGAKSYLLKNTPIDEILEVIRTVATGEKHIPAQVGKKLAERLELTQLSDRECQVLQLMSTGKTNRGISEVMGVSESAVKFHVNNILTKLGVSDRTHAVVTALKRGIIQL
ncbi:response regulator [Aerosakkonemataceae cyanobacterium BLCC-F50]|uniref:Response regulator n=1 Tax=Floridaenema flaviceps BLCC-F50 TaxID=3153642 RepID=A0ABV4XZZ2_9CYAN